MEKETSVLTAIALIAVLVPASLAFVYLVDTVGHYVGILLERASPRMRGASFFTRLGSVVLANIVLIYLLISK